MTETHPEPRPGGGGGMSGKINIPLIGKVPKVAAFGGVAVVIVLIVLKVRSNSAASTAAAAAAPAASGVQTDPAGNVGVIDPATGYVYGSTQDVAALQTSAASQATDTSGGSGGTVSSQVSNGPPFTSNAAWSQYAISILGAGYGSGGDLAGELGLYLAGASVTAAQEDDINAAIGVAGPVPVAGPNGYPPAINVSGSKAGGAGPSPTTTSTSPSSATASTPATPGSPASWQYPAPGNLTARSGGTGKIAVTWAPVVGPQGQRPANYTVAYGRTAGAQTWKDTVSGTSTTLTTQAGMTEYIEVWANGGPVAPPHAGPVEATAGK